mmetsp:Transcript_37751/g.42083  ORF Transcript_37751/g.42083 Transcript_37751/m.42083 type:complete len:238 (-) Transcript_37751:146-859(-)
MATINIITYVWQRRRGTPNTIVLILVVVVMVVVQCMNQSRVKDRDIPTYVKRNELDIIHNNVRLLVRVLSIPVLVVPIPSFLFFVMDIIPMIMYVWPRLLATPHTIVWMLVVVVGVVTALVLVLLSMLLSVVRDKSITACVKQSKSDTDNTRHTLVPMVNVVLVTTIILSSWVIVVRSMNRSRVVATTFPTYVKPNARDIIHNNVRVLCIKRDRDSTQIVVFAGITYRIGTSIVWYQ